jgi:hypothetical protein
MNESSASVLWAVLIDVRADICIRDLYLRNRDAVKPWPERENQTKQRFELWKPETVEQWEREGNVLEAAEIAVREAAAREAAGEATEAASGDAGNQEPTTTQRAPPEQPNQELWSFHALLGQIVPHEEKCDAERLIADIPWQCPGKSNHWYLHSCELCGGLIS